MGKARSAESRELSRKIQVAFGQNRKQARLRSQPPIRQQALAQSLEITRTSISNIETGRHRVFLDQVYAAARTLGVPILELLPQETEIFSPQAQVSIAPGSGITPTEAGELVPIVEEALKRVSPGTKRRATINRKA
jgi:transcriptional regulator with XRE-family HTH domain